jgi:glutathione S-transferase
MTLYLKAGPDGTAVGDCPFAHYVRLVLEEKGLEYDCRPTPPGGKPRWLVDLYEGKMPALRHKKECYVESAVIAQYLEYFFPSPSLSPPTPEGEEAAERALDGFFPAVARYLKEDEQDSDGTALEALRGRLQAVEDHLASSSSSSPDDSHYLCGGESFTLPDCRFLPQLYHLVVGIEGWKGGEPDIASDYPNLHRYWQHASDRPSFRATLYPKETVVWGWGNARNKS